MPLVFLLFVAMPIIEIAVLIQIGTLIGVWSTIGIVILTAIIGTAMLRQQGLATLNTARQRLDAGELPAQQLLEGLLLVVGGVLLLTPGFVTDSAGFVCLIPPTRRWLAQQIAQRSTISGFVVGRGGAAGYSGSGTVNGPGSSPHGGPRSGSSPGNHAGNGATGSRVGQSGQNGGQNDAQPGRNGPTIIDGEYRRDDP